VTDRYHALQQFFLAYFHPDWQMDHRDRSGVVDEFRRTAPSDERARVAGELTQLLAEPLSERDLHRKVLDEYSLFYDPSLDDTTMREWLAGLLNELQESGGSTSGATPLLEDGN
jgi:hypothetical protein